MANISVEISAGLTARLAYLPEQHCNKANCSVKPPFAAEQRAQALSAEESKTSHLWDPSTLTSKQSPAGLTLPARFTDYLFESDKTFCKQVIASRSGIF